MLIQHLHDAIKNPHISRKAMSYVTHHVNRENGKIWSNCTSVIRQRKIGMLCARSALQITGSICLQRTYSSNTMNLYFNQEKQHVNSTDDNVTAHTGDKTVTTTREKSEKSINQKRNIASYISLVNLTFSAKEPERKSLKQHIRYQ